MIKIPTADDRALSGSYSRVMSESEAYLSIRLDLGEPVEISDFAALFAGMGGQFEEYLKDEYPEAAGSVRMYVREVRNGSVIADLFANIPDLIEYMDSALIVMGFASLFSKRVRSWIAGTPVAGAKKPVLRDAADTLRVVANANKGKATLTSYRHHNGIWQETIEAEFTPNDARAASRTIQKQKEDLDAITNADYSRVLMTFKRSDIGKVSVGIRSGERVIIQDISDDDMPLIYASDLTEAQVKDLMINTDENIYHKGFVVDVNVQRRNGRPIAYSITNIHQIIDIDP